MNRGVTVWENDMTEEIDPKTQSFINLHFPNREIKQLSALSHRDSEDIFDSLRESYYILIQPNQLERDQIEKLAQLISHPIYINYYSNTRNWDIQSFIFICMNPWSTLKQIQSVLKNVKDSHSELCLHKILGACQVNFYNFDSSEQYELVTDGIWDTKAIRRK